MKKTGLVFLLALLIAVFFAVPCAASELLEDLFESADLGELEDVLPADLPYRDEVLEKLQSEEGLSDYNLFGALAPSFFASVKESFFSEVRLFATVFCLLLLSAFFSAMRQAFFRDSVGDVVDFLSVLVLAGTAFSALYTTFTKVRQTLFVMSSFLVSMLPVTTAVYSLSGGVATAGAQSTFFLGALTVLDAICMQLLVPLFSASFALSAANAVSGVDLGPLARFLRRTVSLLLSVLFLVLLSALGVQSLLCASADSLTLRSARFAAANFIPAIGGMFSESAKTVFSALSVLRSSVGALGAFSLLWIMLSPLVAVFSRRIVFSLLSAFCAAFSLPRESAFLSECEETLGLLSAIVLSVGAFFLIGFGIFIAVPIGG
ncbi:MAG: hypothetical protein IKT43_03470 [Clostridia bacterium]|nr:hypothetical protein [Clostridia bacterium]